MAENKMKYSANGYSYMTYGDRWIKDGSMIINVVDVDCVHQAGFDKCENEIIFKNGHKVTYYGDIDELWTKFREAMEG